MDRQIQEFMAQAKSDDVWEYKGMTLFLIHKPPQLSLAASVLPNDSPLGKFLRRGHWNGYVISAISIPDDGIENLPAPGGITLCIRGESQTLYGFDTFHAHDVDEPKTKSWVIDETAQLADALLKWAKEHG